MSSLDESNAIRAITIGVSTFIAIITISAVLTYYNTAKATVESIGTGADISTNYSSYILDLLLYNTTTDGIGVKNILNYFYLNDRVSVNIIKMTNMGSVENSASHPITYTQNANNVNNNISLYNNVISSIISTKKFSIRSVSYYDLAKTEIKEITIEEI